MPVTLSTDYDAKVDSKQRITIRGAVAKHYHITVLKDGTFVGKPMELTAQKSVTTPRSGRFMATVPNAGKAAQRASRRPAPPRSVKASFMTGAIAKTKAPAHRQHEETAPISERTMKGMAKAIANVKAGRRGKPVDLVEMAAMKF